MSLSPKSKSKLFSPILRASPLKSGPSAPRLSPKPVVIGHKDTTLLDELVHNVVTLLPKYKIAALGPGFAALLIKCLEGMEMTADKGLVVYVMKKVWPIGIAPQELSDWADQFIADYQIYKCAPPANRVHIPMDASLDKASKLVDSIKEDSSATLDSEDDVSEESSDEEPNTEDQDFIDDREITDKELEQYLMEIGDEEYEYLQKTHPITMERMHAQQPFVMPEPVTAKQVAASHSVTPTVVDHSTSSNMVPTPTLPFTVAEVDDTGVRGFFTSDIKCGLKNVKTRSIPVFIKQVLTAYKGGQPRTDCELLNKCATQDDVSKGAVKDFKSAASVVKPYFDFDCPMQNTPDTSYIRDMVQAWRNQVYEVMKPHVPNLTLDRIIPANRHRPLTDGGFKVSARFFIKGVKTTVKALEEAVNIAKSTGVVYCMDMSVYSSTRKMSMVFCVKDRSSAEDNFPLLPGMVADDTAHIMSAPGFDPLDYVIQYTTPADFYMQLNPTVSTNKHKRSLQSLTTNTTNTTAKRNKGVEGKEKTLLAVLECSGFKNPHLDGEPVANEGTVIYHFRSV
jgi:hypothetical protein